MGFAHKTTISNTYILFSIYNYFNNKLSIYQLHCFFGFEALRASNLKKKTVIDIYFNLCLICLPWIKWGASLLILFNPRRKSEGLRPSDLLKSELRAFGPRSDFRASLALPQEWRPSVFILSVFFVIFEAAPQKLTKKSKIKNLRFLIFSRELLRNMKAYGFQFLSNSCKE